jgi:hypothetical protein
MHKPNPDGLLPKRKNLRQSRQDAKNTQRFYFGCHDSNAPCLERLIAEAEADIAAGRVEGFDKFMARFRTGHNL